ncbi:unnamed protein product, partial [Brassica rapa]
VPLESSPNRRCPWWPASVISNGTCSTITRYMDKWMDSHQRVVFMEPPSFSVPFDDAVNVFDSLILTASKILHQERIIVHVDDLDSIPKLLWLVTFMVSSSKHGGS